jgi:hypothetical protein
MEDVGRVVGHDGGLTEIVLQPCSGVAFLQNVEVLVADHVG